MALAAVASVAGITPASAAPITALSSLSITGSARPFDGTAVIKNATGLDFANAGTYGTAGGTVSLGADGTGSLAGFTLAACPAVGGCGSIQDIPSFGPTNGGTAMVFTPLLPLYTITEGANTVSFSLTSIDSLTRDGPISNSTLRVFGTGFFSLTGFDPTSASFTLTIQGSGQTVFSASTISSGTVFVPEPASLALLGAGLLGLGMMRRRRSL